MEGRIDHDEDGERSPDRGRAPQNAPPPQGRDPHEDRDRDEERDPQLARQLREPDRRDIGTGRSDEPQQHDGRADPRRHRDDATKRLAFGGAGLRALVAPPDERIESGEERCSDGAREQDTRAHCGGQDRIEAVGRNAKSRDQQRGENEELDAHREICGDARRCREWGHRDRPEHGEGGEDAEHDRGGDQVLGHHQREEDQADRQQRAGQQGMATAHPPCPEECGDRVSGTHGNADHGQPVDAVRRMDRRAPGG